MFNIQITTELQGLQQLQEIDKISSYAFETFIGHTNQAYAKFWFKGLDPKIKMQLLGTKALEMFTLSAQAQGFIKLVKTSMGQEYTELGIPNGYTINWNEDGSGVIEGEYIDPNAVVEGEE